MYICNSKNTGSRGEAELEVPFSSQGSVSCLTPVQTSLHTGDVSLWKESDHVSPEMLQQLPMASDTNSKFLSLETSLLCLTLTYFSACFCPCPSHTSCSHHVGLLESPMCTMLSHTRPTFAHAAPPLWGALSAWGTPRLKCIFLQKVTLLSRAKWSPL